MSNQLYLLWLADGLKPRKNDEYYVTSRGKAPLTATEETTVQNFLSYQQANGRIAFYDSNYDVFYLPAKYLEIDYENLSKPISNDYYLTQNGYLIYFGNSETYIEYILSEDKLYLFEFSGDYKPLLDMIVGSNGIKEVYSKKPLNAISEIIRFYFCGREIHNDNFVVKEAQKSALIGDYISSEEFYLGSWKYVPGLHFEKPLLMWPRRKMVGESKLIETDYFTFVENIKEITEFDYPTAIAELAPVASMGGHFYLLVKDEEVVAYACVEKEAITFMYVSYLAVKKTYRKGETSKVLLNSLKILAKAKEKNLLLTIEVHKLLDFYKSNDFKIVDQWRFE